MSGARSGTNDTGYKHEPLEIGLDDRPGIRR